MNDFNIGDTIGTSHHSGEQFIVLAKYKDKNFYPRTTYDIKVVKSHWRMNKVYSKQMIGDCFKILKNHNHPNTKIFL